MPNFMNPMAGRRGDVGYEYRRKVGEWLAQKRVAMGLTQRDVAKALDVRDTAVSAIELGRNTVPPERYTELVDVLRLDKVSFGKFMLKHTNPWLFALLYPREITHAELLGLPDRVNVEKE